MSIPGAASPLFLSAAAAEAAAFQIDRSLRFNSGDSADLSKTFSSAGNRKTWTWSCWYKRSVLGTKNQRLFSCLTGSNDNTYLELRSFDDDTICLSGYATNFRVTDAEIRDPSAWYHLVVACDTTQSSNSDRVKLYLNGVQQTFRTEATITQDADLGFNQAAAHEIGDAFDGYLAEIHFVDGTQLAASDFGEYDSDNNWNPKDCQSSLTYGTNGFYLKFADNSSAAALGTDSSGNSNTWTVNNIDHVASTSIGLPSGYTANASTYSGTLSSIETDDSSGITAASSHIDFDLGASYTVGTVTAKFVNGQGSASANYRIELHGNSSYTNLLANSATLNSSPGSVQTITHDFGSTSAQYLRFSYQGGGRIGTLRFLSTTGATSVSGNPDGDSLIDTPTNYTATSGNNGGNYATLNPLQAGSQCTLSNGNLDLVWSGSTGHAAGSTIAVSSGKWYVEFTVGAKRGLIGIIPSTYATALNIWPGNSAYGSDSYGYYGIGGNLYNNSSNSAYGAGWTTDDVIGIALDLDAGNLVFYKNGSSQGTAATGLSGSYIFAIGFSDTGTGGDPGSFNFGQRPFVYTPPTGHLSLCTTNLADPTIADGSTAMDVVTYSGDGTNGRDITVNHSTDLVWIKSRNQIDNHILADIVRGTDKIIFSHTNIAERSDSTVANSVTAFNSDGFTIGNNANAAQTNQSGFTYVAWSWDGGSSTSSNSDGSITTNVRANASAGFSIIGYTGNATVGATIGHGLNSKPEFFIFKVRSDSGNWYTYHKGYGATKYLTLDRTHSAVANSYLNNTEPTNSVITLSNTFEVNGVNEDLICYAWTSVAGYSSFGSYTGNGSSDGPFIFTGFRPRWILIKDIGGAINWRLLDTARNTFNLAQNGLHPNTAGVENTTNMAMDILSNGFKIKATADINASGNNHIYAAFAEHPFKTSRAR